MSVREIANEFSVKIVSGRYEEAFKMLSGGARDAWSPESLKSAYKQMVEYFEDSKPKVASEFDDEFGQIALDEGTLVYVPIFCEEGFSEAISVMLDPNQKIVSVEFGRP